MIKIINVKSGPSKRLIYYVDFLQINDITGICFTTTNRNDIQSSDGEGTLRSPQFQTFFWYISSAMNSLPNSAPITIHGSNTFFKFRSQLQAQNRAFYWCTCFSTYWSLCLLPWRLLFCIYMFSSCNWIVKDRRDGGKRIQSEIDFNWSSSENRFQGLFWISSSIPYMYYRVLYMY